MCIVLYSDMLLLFIFNSYTTFINRRLNIESSYFKFWRMKVKYRHFLMMRMKFYLFNKKTAVINFGEMKVNNFMKMKIKRRK